MSSITADGLAAPAAGPIGGEVGPLEQKHLQNANYRAVAEGDQITRTHWHIALANALVVWTVSQPTSSLNNLYMIALAAFIGFGAYQSLRAADLRERLPDLRAGRLIRKTLPVEGSVPRRS